MSVFDLVARAAGFERVKAAGGDVRVEAPWLWPLWRQGQPDWTVPTLQGFATAGYADNAIVFACIAAKAQSAALAPLVGYTGQRDAPTRLDDAHALARLLLKPNPYQSWYQFMELLITYLDLDGNAFVWKAPSTGARNGRASAQDAAGLAEVPAGLFPLRSDRVRPVPGRSRGEPLLGYVYDPEDTGAWLSREPYLPHEIIHVKYPNPTDPFEGLGRGSSPLGAAAKPTDVDNAATSFLKNFFDNGVAPFGLLKTKQKLVDTEVKRIRERLRAQYGGVMNWGDVLILDADAEYQRLGLTMQEMSFSDLDFRNEARICSVLRVPPIIVGARVGLERSTFANYAEARTAFWEDSLIPGLYRRFEDGWNAGLSPGEEHWLAYDYSAVPALREDETKKWETATRAFLGGLATRNEARALVKLAPAPPEEDGFRAAGEQQIGAPALGQTPVRVRGGAEGQGSRGAEEQGSGGAEGQGDDEAEGQREDGKATSPFGMKIILEAADEGDLAARLQVEAAGMKAIGAALRRQMRAALPKDATAADLGDAEGRMLAAAPGLRDAVYAMMRQACALGLARAQAQVEGLLGVGEAGKARKVEINIDWSLINGGVLRWLEEYTFGLVRAIDENSRRQLWEAIDRWARNGLPLPDLVKELAPIFGPVRASMIASTEVTRAYAEANLRAWQASGVIERVSWRVANDERVCAVCSALGGIEWGDDGAVPASIADQMAHGVVTPIGQPFVHPGGHGTQERFAGQEFRAPPAHPRCRCWLAPVV